MAETDGHRRGGTNWIHADSGQTTNQARESLPVVDRLREAKGHIPLARPIQNLFIINGS